jgi:ribosome-associated protein
VIATARNARHANAMARELSMAAKAAGVAFRRISGVESESGWVLLDFDLVVVHLFDAEKRAFYNLENLWSDVPRVPFEARPRAAAEQPADLPTADLHWPGPDADWPRSSADL